MKQKLVYTEQAIVDPLAFLEGDASLVDGLTEEDFLVVSGTDIDFSVSVRNEEVTKWTREERVQCGMLGKLYIAGEATGVEVPQGVADIFWAPSPRYSNQLAEDLGLVPGKDVFRFVHDSSPEGKVSDEPYAQYTQAGELSQSVTTKRYFEHDHGPEHPIGTLLMPPTTTAALIKYSGDSLVTPLPNPRRFSFQVPHEAPVKKAARSTDYVTGVIGIIAGGKRELGYYIPDYVGFFIKHSDFEVWGTGAAKEPRSNKEKRTIVYDHIKSWLDVMEPRIQAVQKSRGLTPKILKEEEQAA